MTFYRLICHAVLLCYPKWYRQERQAELVNVLLDRVADRSQTTGIGAGLRFAMRELTALVGGIPVAWSRRTRHTRDPSHVVRPSPWTVDIVFAVRSLRRHPWYTATVILTLAVGIGANTAMFSVVNSVLMRPLDYRDPDALGLVWNKFPETGEEPTWVHDLQLQALREQSTQFEGLAAMRMVSGRILGGKEPLHTDVARVSSEFFDLLGVQPLLGRTFNKTDDDYQAPWVAILSHDYWTREFDQDSSIIGQHLVVGFPSMKVIGVLPPTFDHRMYESLGHLVVPEIWIPHQVDYEAWSSVEPGTGVAVLARLRDDTSFDRAATELNALAAKHGKTFFHDAELTYEFVPLLQDVVQRVRPSLLMLLGVVGFVLLITLANITTLAIGRLHSRNGEFAVRRAMGASTWRLLKSLLIENAVPAVLGAALGVGLAVWGKKLLLSQFPMELPRSVASGVDSYTFAFVSVLAIVATIIPAIVPALHLRKTDPVRLLQRHTNAPTSGTRANHAQGSLVLVQIVLSVVLLVGAVLSGRSFLLMRGVEPGFEREGVLTFSTFLMQEYETPQQRDDFFAKLENRIRGLPSVTAVGATTALPLSPPSFGPVFNTQQQQQIRYSTWPGQGVEVPLEQVVSGEWLTADINAARPGYFSAMGIDLLAGREFVERDGLFDPPAIVIDERLSETFWGTKNAVGKKLWVFNTWANVVGVTRHANHHGYGSPGRPQLYIPYAAVGSTKRTSVVVRTEGDPLALLPAIRREIHAIDPMVPIADIETMEHRMDRATADYRFLVMLMIGFATIAVSLAALGIYSVLAITVTNRRREIAVRVALGAAKSNIALMVVGNALWLTAIGGAVGLMCAVLGGSRLAGLLYAVHHDDLSSLGLAVVGLMTITMLAAWVPVRRAASVDPQITLRSE